MQIKRYDDPQQFCAVAMEFLLRNEAANNIMLGSAPQLAPGGGDFLCTFHDDADAVVGAAMMMVGRPLDISDAPDEAVEMLADMLAREREVPSVLALPRQADLFVRLWVERKGVRVARETALAVHQLDRVIWPRPVSGAMRQARVDERELVAQWITAFSQEIHEPITDGDDRAGCVLEQGRMYVWEDDSRVVSMAGWTRPMPNGVAIGFVYTPRELRGRGYASNCVAALSQRMLDAGKKFCALYTDLANPTSNKIYREIGYRHICDSKHVFFEP